PLTLLPLPPAALPISRAGALLLEALRDESDPSARTLFVETLGHLRHEAAIATLGQIVESRSEGDEARAAACVALGTLGKPQAIPDRKSTRLNSSHVEK